MKTEKLAFICIFILVCIIPGCKNSPSGNSEVIDDIDKDPDLFETVNIPPVDQSDTDWDKITYLIKTGEISEGFSNEEENFFVKITDLCIDQENNLYVADSGLRKIFKFDALGNFVYSFGQTGQGPSEFLGRLRINVGNDNNLYITDDKNYRLFSFTKDGEFISQFNLPLYKYDYAVVSSEGEIFFLSESGIKIIDHFDSRLKYLSSFLEMKYCLDFPYKMPSRELLYRLSMRPSTMEIHKLITKDDNIAIIFNNSQIVTYFNKNLELVHQFRINHPRFIKDYKKRINDAKKKSGWINCFGSAFLDEKNNFNICYFNGELRIPEVYRYSLNGKFIDTLRVLNFNSTSNQIIRARDLNGNFYGTEMTTSKIVIYREIE
ncbi:6-bladed beta-propeller [Acidobacteriota bacterium]